MKPLNQSVELMPHSGIREIVNLAITLPDVIRLEIGEPNFGTPAHIVEAAFRAAKEGYTGYTASAGLLSLRELLVDKLEKVNNIKAIPDNITVTVGAVGGVASAVLALCEHADEVLIPDPAWPNYDMIAQCIGAVPRKYPCRPENEFLPDLEKLDSLVTKRTKVIIVNSPANPSGAVFPREMIEGLLEFAHRNDLWVVGDEVYDQLIFERKHISPFALDDDGRVVSVFSFSKTYAMTGWRVGYVVAPVEVSKEIEKLQEPFVSCAPSISQKAAEAALRGPQERVEVMREAYRKRRDMAIDILKNYDLYAYTPQGAFYILVDISKAGMGSRAFTFSLLEERKVAVAPGQAFGEIAANHVRVSLATEDSELKEGLERLCSFVHEMGEIDRDSSIS